MAKPIIKSTASPRTGAIIEQFKLRQLPQQRSGRFYQDTAAYGHFGRPDLNLPWEDVTDKASNLLQAEAKRLQKGSSL